MKRAGLRVVLAASALASFLAPAQARPLEPAERRYLPWDAKLPLCQDQSVLGDIASRFSDRELTYWKSGLAIQGYDHVRQIGFRSNGLDYIPRRYCMARATMNDGKLREVSYAIGEDLDFAGGDFLRSLTLPFGADVSLGEHWGLVWCVAGLDRNYAFALNCKAARP